MAPTAPAPASELERRKQVKIRLRSDLVIEPHKYEGRTYHVIKDPVSLRYYRLKEHEHFLLQFMDGKATLDDAQKAYEKHYRPDRLKLEDLEAFAQQLLTAGLAQNDSPRAGQQLFDRRRKRKRTERIQAFTNILYIKLPLFDPDKLLTGMLRYLWWIFTPLFLMASVTVMLAAVLLVATHFETFLSKLPNYYEFFSFKTVVYLWLALGVVKVIHEFGHGLSCKAFGGEVHEMGALFLCLSPALYCNVSDAWTLPNKWHRIIISAAGIYVELIIASIATFVWWNTSGQPFVNNLALSLMVVCSISTVVFNANPLMRYDGYYVLSDWLEIPNLRERSNRFLKNLTLEHCLGIEVQPEPYMELWRKVLFVSYAVLSYVYRWVVTFAILYFLYSFLKPYKLQVVSAMLTMMAIGSMIAWPLYRLGKGIYRRGRLPDMKRGRVMVSGAVLLALVLFLCLVPVPISRLRGQALVQSQPEATAQLFVDRAGRLEKLNVRPGQTVRKGDVLAEFSDHDLESKLAAAKSDARINEEYVKVLDQLLGKTSDQAERRRNERDRGQAEASRANAAIERQGYEKIKKEKLTLTAPCDGVIGVAPRVEDVGKTFEPDPVNPFLTLYEPGRLCLVMPMTTAEFNQLLENLPYNPSTTGKAAPVDVDLRVHGLDARTWKGKIARVPPSEAKTVPLALSSRGGGPVAVKAGGRPDQLVPQTQHFLVSIDVVDPDDAIAPGVMGQAKVHLKPETCLRWLWRTVNNTFDLGLL